MIHRFIEVLPHKLYRGSAPSPQDVINLYKHYGIRKIVSLDKDTGHAIEKVCKMLQIEHVLIPLHPTAVSIKPLIHLLQQDLYKLLIEGGPTYVHCYQGKDRTGLVVAMFKCQYMGMDCHAALDEAKRIGFGIGLEPKVIKLFEKLICKSCKSKHNHTKKDDNDADIVGNSREHYDFMGSVIDSATMQSFAPFMDGSKWQPYSPQYYYVYDQYPTRTNFDLPVDGPIKFEDDTIPQIGIYDDSAGVRGFGPVELGSGFSNV